MIGLRRELPSAPQQHDAPARTRCAASPYFSRTTSLNVGFGHWRSPYAGAGDGFGADALLRVQHSANRKPRISCSARCSRCSAGTCFRGAPPRALRSSACRDDATASKAGCRVRRRSRRRPGPPGGRTAAAGRCAGAASVPERRKHVGEAGDLFEIVSGHGLLPYFHNRGIIECQLARRLTNCRR